MRCVLLELSAALTLCGCLDTSLADELNWPDGGKPGDVSGGMDAGEDDRADGRALGDGGGGPPWPDGSSADADDTTPPWLVPAAGCGGSEELIGSVCASSGPFGIGLRFWASEPVTASARFEPDGGRVGDDRVDIEHHLLLAPLSPSSAFEITLEIIDRAALATVEGPLSINTAPQVESVVISEVLFDPLGAEPEQEFVELYNLGAEDVDLSGWIIADEGGSDAFPPSTVLRGGGYGVVVSEGFQPSAGGDPPPAPGALMIRLSGPIGSQGLRNTGEALTLSDGTNRLISSLPVSITVPGPGISIERASPHAPDGDPANWLPNAAGSATPGGRNSVSE